MPRAGGDRPGVAELRGDGRALGVHRLGQLAARERVAVTTISAGAPRPSADTAI